MKNIPSLIAISEESMQLTIMGWVRLQPELAKIIMHFPNEGKRTPRYGKLLKSMGMRPGVSDLFIAKSHGHYIGAWIELKTPTGKLTMVQRQFLDDMVKQNYFCCVCRSIEETIEVIQWYCQVFPTKTKSRKEFPNHQTQA